mgnify:CR=1 FL=1
MAQVTIRPDTSAAAAALALGHLAEETLAAALARGLVAALQQAAGEVQLLASERGIQSRSGALLNSISGWPDGEGALSGRVGVSEDSPARKYAALLTKDGIRPTTKKALTIPIGANLTGSGVARYATVADLEAAFPGQVFRPRNSDAICVATRTRSGEQAVEAYFLLRQHVEGVGALEDGVEGSAAEMAALIQDEVDQVIP